MAVAPRLYARALFEAAQEQGRVATVRDQLRQLASALDESPELDGILSNPQIEPSAKADILEQVTEGADELLRNFLRLVAEKGRSSELRGMADALDALVDEAEGRVQVELTTAHELSDAEAAAIVRKIEEASGRKVEATRTVDSGLVGGLILQAGSLRVDASVRGRLERLRRELATRT
ncbi:MAG TPA: ATP synthase F1 subunit delta [Gaiella sp.]|jgi:F-type H+-transporting ATPase subunit delta